MLSGIADAVIFSDRAEVVRIVNDVLRKKGVANVVMADTRELCIDGLKRFAKALLIVDWLIGDKNVVSTLSVNARQPLGRQRPIMLIAEQVTTQLVALCADYGVSQIYTEPLSIKNMSSRLTALLVGESSPDEIKKILSEINEMKIGGAISDAATMLKINLKKYPTNLKIKCELADTLLALDKPEEAVGVLKGMDHTKPPYLRGIHLLGRAYLKLGKYDDALKTMALTQLYNAHDAERLVDIGQALLHLDRFKEARQSFDQALEIEPQNKQAKVGKGQSYMMDGAVNEALTLLKESSTDVEIASIFNTCAVMNMRKGRHQVGMDLYSSALVAVGSSTKLKSRLFFNMGLGYRRWSKKDKAIECFEKAKSLDPSFKKINQQLNEIQGAGPKNRPVPPSRTARPSGIEAPLEESLLGGSEPVNVEHFSEVFGDFDEQLDLTSDISKLMDGDLEESLFGNPSSLQQKNKKSPA